MGSSFLGCFSFLVAMLVVPPYFLVCPACADARLYAHHAPAGPADSTFPVPHRSRVRTLERVQDHTSVGAKKKGSLELSLFVPATSFNIE